MNKIQAVFAYLKGYIDKSLASNTAEDRAADKKINDAVKVILGKK